jgi:hypothetical protein
MKLGRPPSPRAVFFCLGHIGQAETERLRRPSKEARDIKNTATAASFIRLASGNPLSKAMRRRNCLRPRAFTSTDPKEASVASNKISKGKNALIGIETEKARAVRELDKAEVATREAIDDLKQTSRELMNG